MRSSIEVVSDFLRAFMSGDVDRASKMVTEDFWFVAPLHQGREDGFAYFRGAAEKVRFIRAFRILHQWADGEDVSTIYELDVQTPEGFATMTMSEWHTVKAGRVASIRMVFNAAAEAARLLARALGARH